MYLDILRNRKVTKERKGLFENVKKLYFTYILINHFDLLFDFELCLEPIEHFFSMFPLSVLLYSLLGAGTFLRFALFCKTNTRGRACMNKQSLNLPHTGNLFIPDQYLFYTGLLLLSESQQEKGFS